VICPSCQIDNESGSDVCLGCGKSLAFVEQGAVISSRYEILGLLGKGGMGMVYRAHDRFLDEVVAIKVLRSEFVDTPEVAQRFRSEIKLARKVSHPNVCRIHEYGIDGAINYISMALIEGTDLSRLVREHPAGLPTDAAFALALQVTEGLQAIHDVGIIHRDLKSSNVICDAVGVARLMDFGIAKDSLGNGQLTADGQVMGTPEYMSPEQCHGEALDFRSDVYSLGIVIYEIFTGRVPFRGETLMATLLKQVQDELPLGPAETERMPAGVVAALRKALDKDPARRFGTASEVAEALREARKAHAGAAAAESAGVPVSPSLPETPSAERRRDTRLPISLDILLQRSSAGGAVLQEERTIADNVGRHGVRVLTTMTSISKGDTVNVRQVDGDFQSRSAVRHVYTGADRFRKLGLEFLDRAAPDHLLPSDGSQPRTPLGLPKAPAEAPPPAAATPSSPPSPPSGVPPVAPPPEAPPEERRKDSRLSISVDVRLRRLGPSGAVLEEERTVADNVGRHGARVLSAMTGLSVGEILSVHEVGTDFQTRAEIRALYLGPDRIQRLGLQFLDHATPVRLLPDGDSKPRLPRPPSAPVAPPPPPPPQAEPEPTERRRQVLAAFEGLRTRNHFEVLDIPRASNAMQVKEAYFRLVRQFHGDVQLEPDVADLRGEIDAIYLRIVQAYETLIDPQSRARYESLLGRPRTTPFGVLAAPQAPAAQEPGSAPPGPPPPLDEESAAWMAQEIAGRGRTLLAEGKFWDAIQALEGGLNLAPGSRSNQTVRILLAQATAKNPRWRKRAEEMLVELTRERPVPVEALLVLSAFYQEEGFKARAAAQLRKALEVQPGHPEALERLKALY
jgi:serine/threonine protein kinase